MIKVLAHGNQHLQAVCPRCGCLFEYETEDIYSVQMIPADNKGNKYFIRTWKEVRCPECGFGINVGGTDGNAR